MSAIPISRPNVRVAPRRRKKARTYLSTRECVLWAAVFSVIALFVFGASSLSGHVLVETARRQEIQANQRLRAANAAQTALSREIEILSEGRTLEAWALRNGFDASEDFPETSRRIDAIVARR